MDQCPFEAMIFHKGEVHVIKGQCHGCGLCAAVCPVGAVSFSTYDGGGKKQGIMDPLADLPCPQKGQVLVVTCTAQKAAVCTWITGNPWAGQVTCMAFSCIAAASPLFMARALNMGFGTVVFLCPDNGCTNGCAVQQWRPIMTALNRLRGTPDTPAQLVAIREKPVEAKAVFLDLMAQLSSKNSKLNPEATVIEPSDDARQDLCRNLCKLACDRSIDGHRVENLALPFFDLSIDTKHCTLCGACAKNCPTHALEMNNDRDRRLLFSSHRCIGCKTCVNKCPEQALSLHRIFDLPVIENSVKKEKARDDQAVCRNCGTPIANQSLLEKVEKDLRQKGMDKSADTVFLCTACKKKNILPAFFNSRS
jgi:ferredoxin